MHYSWTAFCYSWHEMGHYDLPATIDYMLLATGYQQILFVGHSMGNTVFFVMCTSKPKYNIKVEHMIALGPTVFLGNISTPLKPLAPIFFPARVSSTKLCLSYLSISIWKFKGAQTKSSVNFLTLFIKIPWPTFAKKTDHGQNIVEKYTFCN